MLLRAGALRSVSPLGVWRSLWVAQVKVNVAPEGDPVLAAYCHCEECRRVFGAPVNMLVVNPVDKVNVVEVSPLAS